MGDGGRPSDRLGFRRMSSPRVLTLALLAALCSAGATVPALAQTEEGDECVEGCASAQAPVVDNKNFQTAYFLDALRKGQPFLCGNPADESRKIAEVGCRIDAKISIPAKAAKFLGLSSRVLAHGVAGDMVEHFKEDGDDYGRAYFLELPSALRSKLKAKKIRGLGVTITGTITVAGADQVYCGSGRTLHASCPIDYGKKANIWPAQDGEMVCWRVMPWWVATKSAWGKMCPRPINA
jgi:hypothetical protein